MGDLAVLCDPRCISCSDPQQHLGTHFLLLLLLLLLLSPLL
jgi:hypothetical protein